MAYSITTPQGDKNEPENTIRDYWARSHNGEYLAEFEAGRTGGESDLEDGSYDYRDILRETHTPTRDLAWSARFDGYCSIVEKTRGPIFHIGD